MVPSVGEDREQLDLYYNPFEDNQFYMKYEYMFIRSIGL